MPETGSKIMVKQELLDEKLVLEQTSHYKLSIQVSLDGFSFCCLDDRTKRYVAVKDYTFANISSSFEEACFNIAGIVNDEELLKQPYKEIRCMLVAPSTTLVPSSLFVEGKAFSYIKNLISLPEGEVETFSCKLSDSSITAVFAYPKILTSLIREISPEAKFYSYSIPFINKQISEHTASPAQLAMFICGNTACYSLIQNKALKISTSFTFESTTDLVYYTLLLLKEHGLKPAEVEVYISGKVEKHSPRHSELSQYLPNLAFDCVPRGYEYSYRFKNKAEHQFSNLFKLVECE